MSRAQARMRAQQRACMHGHPRQFLTAAKSNHGPITVQRDTMGHSDGNRCYGCVCVCVLCVLCVLCVCVCVVCELRVMCVLSQGLRPKV